MKLTDKNAAEARKFISGKKLPDGTHTLYFNPAENNFVIALDDTYFRDHDGLIWVWNDDFYDEDMSLGGASRERKHHVTEWIKEHCK